MNDEDPGFFTERRIAILGMGLMGTSLAMALQGKCTRLIGIDPDPAVIEYLNQQHVCDEAGSDPAALLLQADLIILAAPVQTIISLIHSLPLLHPGPAIVMDLGSTKTEILRAMQDLPERFDPIGLHPMSGKEKSGPMNADPAIFRNAPFALVPLERTSSETRTLAEHLALLVGARPLWLDSDTHDRWVAATSHVPFLVSSALAAATPLEAAPLVGSGFRSAARLAGTSTTMMMDILATNRSNILHSMHQTRIELEHLEKLIMDQDDAGLKQALDQIARHYQDIITKG
jgi:prephenate dehydrogenase